MKINPNFEKILLGLLVFLLPSQLAFHFWPSWAFVFGIRIDYLSPAIYLTDILVVLLLVNWFVCDRLYIVQLFKKYKNHLIGFLLIVFVNSLFSTIIFPTVFKWLKILELILFSLYISNRSKVVGKKVVFNSVFVSLVFFSLIGVVQFLISRTIGGTLYFLGERSFVLSTPGIALANIFGQEYIRAYSTFPHPNSMAGYLAVASLFLFENGFFVAVNTQKNKKIFLGLLIIFCGFITTFSVSAFLGLGVIVLLPLLIKNKSFKNFGVYTIFTSVVLGSLLLPVVADKLLSAVSFKKNISERLELATIAGPMINQKFLLGEGFNTFIINMPKIKPTLTSSWLLQPVHNIFLLVLSEVGVFGLLLLLFYLYKSLDIYPLVFVFVILTGFFDHYWLDAQQNLLLLAVVSAFVFKTKK